MSKPKRDVRASFLAFKAAAPKRGPQCRACRARETHPELMAEAEKLLTEGEYQSTVATWLQSEGVELQKFSLGEHWRNHMQVAR